MRKSTEKQWCSISREGVDSLARELYAADYPDDGPLFLGFSNHLAAYYERVYVFDTAMQRCGFVLVKGA